MARHDQAVAILVDRAQVAWAQCEVHGILLTGFKMDAGERAKRSPGSSGIGRKREIDLDYLVPSPLAFVAHIHIERKRLTRCQTVLGKTQSAVGELRVGQAVAKGIER